MITTAVLQCGLYPARISRVTPVHAVVVVVASLADMAPTISGWTARFGGAQSMGGLHGLR
jgi:hypothetical protein